MNYFDSLLTGIIANIVFTIFLIYGIQKFRFWYFIRRNFHNKKFNTYWKRYPNDVVHTVICTVKGNVICFKGSNQKKPDVFEGQFIINPINLKMGEGYHSHYETDGFAFLKVIVKDKNTLLVDAPYTGVKENEKKQKG